MVPDRGFMKKLKALDPNLGAHWDHAKERWVITERVDGLDEYVMVVQSPLLDDLGVELALRERRREEVRRERRGAHAALPRR